jgi:DNA-binding NarL/FixJ family response regulator
MASRALAGACVKILILDDHVLFRAGLRMLLSAIDHNVSCVEAATLTDALALIAEHADLQLCLLDPTLKNEHGLDAIQRIKATAPHIAVVVLSGADDSATIPRCIDAGAMSFIPKSVAPEVLIRALQYVLSGAVYLPEQITSAMEEASQPPLITPQQHRVR